MAELAAWQNFYVIVGSSAGALIGLQFVVLSLIANRPTSGPDEKAGHAFATPTIVHFGAALGLSALLSAPWDSATAPATIWGFGGLSGLVYAIVVSHRMRTQKAYQPEFEDWAFHVLLPFTAYAALTISAYSSRSHLPQALFAVAAAVLLLLFVGIHNAWDAVTYHVFVNAKK